MTRTGGGLRQFPGLGRGAGQSRAIDARITGIFPFSLIDKTLKKLKVGNFESHSWHSRESPPCKALFNLDNATPQCFAPDAELAFRPIFRTYAVLTYDVRPNASLDARLPPRPTRTALQRLSPPLPANLKIF